MFFLAKQNPLASEHTRKGINKKTAHTMSVQTALRLSGRTAGTKCSAEEAQMSNKIEAIWKIFPKLLPELVRHFIGASVQCITLSCNYRSSRSSGTLSFLTSGPFCCISFVRSFPLISSILSHPSFMSG